MPVNEKMQGEKAPRYHYHNVSLYSRRDGKERLNNEKEGTVVVLIRLPSYIVVLKDFWGNGVEYD